MSTIEIRWNGVIHTTRCFVCDLETTGLSGHITVADSRDRHTRLAHPHCWALIMRYAQVVVESQLAGQTKP